MVAFRFTSVKLIDQERFPKVLNALRLISGDRPFRPKEKSLTRICEYVIEVPDDCRRARAKIKILLTEEADRFGGLKQAEAYTETLLLRIHKTDFSHASAKQLWQVFFTLRNRIHRKAKNGNP